MQIFSNSQDHMYKAGEAETLRTNQKEILDWKTLTEVENPFHKRINRPNRLKEKSVN
jgi:hypothetical protein